MLDVTQRIAQNVGQIIHLVNMSIKELYDKIGEHTYIKLYDTTTEENITTMVDKVGNFTKINNDKLDGDN